jgi:mono/diheme cytochrome c family protein
MQCLPLRTIVRLTTLLAVLGVVRALGAETGVSPGAVRSILSEHCFVCHGPDAAHRQADLRLDTRDGAFAARSGRAAVRAGQPDESEMLRRITASDPDERMPPKSTGKLLTSSQIDLLRRWIAEGARWKEHWAFAAVENSDPPDVPDAVWCRNGIDRFVLARLAGAALRPSPPAPRSVWLRRVTLDLTGLPPTLDEIDSFLADSSPQAEERVVDRLLASPRYGERMALDWLDAARYADTNGYFSDLERTMWPWREWVIAAMNENRPFDQFTVEQLAGDLLPQPTTAQLIASGFHRNQPVTNESGIIDEEYRVEYVAERVDTTAAIWLGLTAGCARCHDHKFDPVSQREYYQLFAFFNQGPETGLVKDKTLPPSLPVPTVEQRRQLELLRHAKDAGDRAFAKHEPALKASLADWETTAEETLPQPTVDGLRVHFDFDRRLSDDARMLRLEPQGEPDFQPGVLGDALSFDGGRHVEAPAVPWDSDAAWSLSLWLRFSGPSSVGCVVSCTEQDGDRRGWDVLWRKGYLIVNLVHRWGADAIEVWTVDSATANRWHHLAVTYDGSQRAAGLEIYVDGQRQKLRIQQDSLTGSLRSNQPLRLGRRDSGLGYYGQLDEVRGYQRVLTPQEIAELHRGDRLRSIVRTPQPQRTNEQREQLLDEVVQHAGSADVQRAWRDRQSARRAVEELESAIPTVMIAQDRPKSRETFVLERGQYDHPGEPVSADVPGVLPRLGEGAARNRLGLAQWLVDPTHPLTSRVAVNRAWQHFFGAGLVRTTNDFGAQGEPPTHPELLDWLAWQFVRSGWDRKALDRLIVTSATYRQSSSAVPALWQRDPDNRLLARGPRFRLPGEVLRDQALAVSGLLVEQLGGPSVKPYQPAGLWEAVTYGAEHSYEQDHGPALYRRGLYTYWKRQVPHPALLTFDAPTREACVVQRSRTNTPLQALVLLNDVTFVEAARALAERMMEHGRADAAECIRHGFLRTVAREPVDDEVQRLTSLWKRRRAEFQAQPTAATALLGVGESPRDLRFAPADLAAWTVVANVLLNLDEAVTKP